MARLVLLAFVVACGAKDEAAPPDAGRDRYRLDRPCITSVLGAPLVPSAWDELLVAHACEGQFLETFQYGPDLFGLIGTQFPFRFELIGWSGGRVIAIEDSRRIAITIGPSLQAMRFEHTFEDVTFVDLDGDIAMDFVTAGDAIRRGQVTNTGFIEAAAEVELLAGKPFRFIAIAELGGSSLPDLFYVTADGEVGIAIQTAPDVFAAEPLAIDPGTPRRMHVADVDGDGRDDVVGAVGHLFVYSSKTGAIAQLDEPVHAVAVGDFNADGIGEPVFVTADRAAVRHVLVAPDGTLASEPLLPAGGDAMTIVDVDGDYLDDIVLVHDAGTPASWLRLHRGFTF